MLQNRSEDTGSFVKIFHYDHKRLDYALPHTHNAYELIFYKDGMGSINIGDDIYNYTAGTCIVIEAGMVHDELSETDSHVYCMQFYSPAKFPTRLFKRGSQNSAVIEKIYTALEKILLLKSDKQLNARYIEQEVKIVVISLMQLYNIHNDNRSVYQEQVVLYVKNEIESRLNVRINWDIIAEQVGYSSNRLRKLFKIYTSKSPYQYVCDKRLSKAKKMLQEEGDSIGRIAKSCGFNSVIRFDLFFKEKMGMSPGCYRKISNQTLPDSVYRRM